MQELNFGVYRAFFRGFRVPNLFYPRLTIVKVRYLHLFMQLNLIYFCRNVPNVRLLNLDCDTFDHFCRSMCSLWVGGDAIPYLCI